MLSAFNVHPDRTFRDWLDDNSSRSDIDKLNGDLVQVGFDMFKTTTEQINRDTDSATTVTPTATVSHSMDPSHA